MIDEEGLAVLKQNAWHVLDALLSLPGFDEMKMIKATGGTLEALFLVWTR
ncbi:hypothetical protein [Aurantiacibacter sediminis]|uniref:Uncharacterized protein n=1 Tax=Aurantiacibacter sediminis TaxID=2793064 RepID=A0ABS0N245_9SPHN|nr:hypothetical protein [Aurantiacibacter sediminis]MBH5321326.1 hypothetical protein [Aurantiacibacter sediminis]